VGDAQLEALDSAVGTSSAWGKYIPTEFEKTRSLPWTT
jgi:hypothetical protein